MQLSLGGSDLTHIRRYYIAWNRARICCRLLYVLRNSPDGPPLSCQPLYYTFRHRLWTTICIWHGTIVAHGMMILTIFHRRRRLVARCERAKGARPFLLTCVIFFSETDSFFDMSIGSISLYRCAFFEWRCQLWRGITKENFYFILFFTYGAVYIVVPPHITTPFFGCPFFGLCCLYSFYFFFSSKLFFLFSFFLRRSTSAANLLLLRRGFISSGLCRTIKKKKKSHHHCRFILYTRVAGITGWVTLAAAAI